MAKNLTRCAYVGTAFYGTALTFVLTLEMVWSNRGGMSCILTAEGKQPRIVHNFFRSLTLLGTFCKLMRQIVADCFRNAVGRRP